MPSLRHVKTILFEPLGRGKDFNKIGLWRDCRDQREARRSTCWVSKNFKMPAIKVLLKLYGNTTIDEANMLSEDPICVDA
jgi:hypothetical protein